MANQKKSNRVAELLKEKCNSLIEMFSEEDRVTAASLLDEILLLKAQDDVKPTRVYIEDAAVKQEMKGEYYSIACTNKEVIFHLDGGLTLIADEPIPIEQGMEGVTGSHGFPSLVEALHYVVESEKKMATMKKKKDKEVVEGIVMAIVYILQLPTYVFSSDELMQEIMGSILSHIHRTMEQLKTLGDDDEDDDDE